MRAREMFKMFQQYYPIRNVLFVIIESFLIFLCIFAVLMIFHSGSMMKDGIYIFSNLFIITMICQICIYYADLYQMNDSMSFRILAFRLLQALLLSCAFLGIIYFVFPGLLITPGIVLAGCVLTVFIIGTNRFFYSLLLQRGLFNKKIIIVGESDLSNKIIDEIQERTDCGYEISCVVLNQFKNICSNPFITVFKMEDFKGLCELVKEQKIRTVVVAIKEKRGNFPSEELLRCRIEGAEVLDGNSFYEMLSGKLVVNELYPSWLIFSKGFNKSTVNSVLKRIFDIILSLFMLIAFFPLMVLVAILIKLDSKGPVFYTQERVGQNSRNYTIIKFRSMVVDAEAKCGPQCALENDPRITGVGRFLRKLRIDEMPQLWNVLKGEMSFVGPRPEREVFVREYEKQIPYYRERFSVKPGITGWAQIRYQYGANAEENLEKLNYDLFYIKNMSFFMDFMIVLRTIKIVMFGKGAR